MVMEKKTREEKILALKASVQLREKWVRAVKSGLSSDQMKDFGIKTLKIEP